MARCKLTTMNLRNIRKTREYQCLLIDLVKTGVVGKSAAEGLLGYTIPEGLLGGTTPVVPNEDPDPTPDEVEVNFLVTGRDETVATATVPYGTTLAELLLMHTDPENPRSLTYRDSIAGAASISDNMLGFATDAEEQEIIYDWSKYTFVKDTSLYPVAVEPTVMEEG